MLIKEMVQNLMELVEFGDESFIEMVKQLDGKNIQEDKTLLTFLKEEILSWNNFSLSTDENSFINMELNNNTITIKENDKVISKFDFVK